MTAARQVMVSDTSTSTMRNSSKKLELLVAQMAICQSYTIASYTNTDVDEKSLRPSEQQRTFTFPEYFEHFFDFPLALIL